MILSIPPSCTNRQDTLANGKFTVQSAYFLQQELNNKGKAECSSTVGHSRVWKKNAGFAYSKLREKIYVESHKQYPSNQR
jgi:hypothetical protein